MQPEPGRSPCRRPPRLKEVFTQRGRPVFFVTICTQDRRPILDNKRIHEAFRSFCSRSPDIGGLHVGRYVIMPEHIHAFVSAEGSDSLGRWVGSLKRHLTHVLKGSATVGQIWQQGFFDHLFRSCESYAEKWEYVRRNPVRAGLVSEAGAWAFAGEIGQIVW